MAGLDIDVPAAGQDTGLPPAQAATPAKKKTVPNPNGLNEWVSSPQFAADREKQIQDYYDQQLARIQAKQNSLSERWGLSDIRASYGAPSAEAQNQRMQLRREEVAGDRAREKEVFEGKSNLAQMKQAVQTRRAFNDYLEKKDYYASLAQKATNPKEKEQYEQAALSFDKKAQFLDPQSYSAFAEEGRAGLKSVAPDSMLVNVNAIGKPSVVAQGGVKTSDLISATNTMHSTGVNPLAGRGGATVGGGAVGAAPSAVIGGGPTAGAGAGGGGGAPAGASARPITSSPGAGGATAPGAAPEPADSRLAALDNYKPPAKPVINQLPPAKREEMLIKQTPAFQKAQEQIGGYARMDKVISDILQNPEAMAIATGQTGFIEKFRNPKARNAALQLENLRELSSIEGLKKLRASGTAPGAITEAEWPKFESFFVNLKNAQSPAEMQRQLEAFRTKLTEEAANSRYGYEGDYGADARLDKSFDAFRKNAEGRRPKTEIDKKKQTTVAPENDVLGLFK